jgi:uncharacterized protein
MRVLKTIALTAVFAAAGVFGADEAKAAKLKVLMITGHDVVPAHPWRETTPYDRATLEASGRFEVVLSEDSAILESSSLDKYDAILLNYGFWTAPALSARAKENLLAYVKNGKGLVPLHFACSAYQDWPEYQNLIGRVWKKDVAGHGPRAVFDNKVVNADHPITKGLKDFKADDELYAKLSGDAKIEVLVTANSADFSKKDEPLVFTLTYGKGRVAQDLYGHDVKARSSAAYKLLLCRCLEWAATGTVTIPADGFDKK